MAATETVVINTVTNVGGVVRQGANQVALLAPLDATATVAAGVVKKYRQASLAGDDHGDGSLLHLGTTAAIASGAPFVFTVGVAPKSGSPFTDTDGDTTAITTGQLTPANMPITPEYLDAAAATQATVTATRDSTPQTVIFTHEDPTTLTLAAEETAINPSTGVWASGTTTSGSAAGMVITYTSHDWDAALEKLDLESYEIHAPAGFPYSAESYGVFNALATHATQENKILAGGLESAVAPADVKELVEEGIRNGRFVIGAAHYTGDFTSAFAGDLATFPVNGSLKEQVAAQGVTYTDSYLRSEFGDEETPAVGTFHNMGVNAVFRDRGGSYRYSNDRASTGLTDFERFESTRRSIRYVQNNMEEDLLAARRGNSLAFPYTDAGIGRVKRVLEASLQRSQQAGIIDQYDVQVPILADVDETDRLNRVLPDTTVFIRLAGQIHLFRITLEVSL